MNYIITGSDLEFPSKLEKIQDLNSLNPRCLADFWMDTISETKPPIELEPFLITVPPERMHDALAYASLFFGESPTMASESAVLGTPAVFLNENWFGYTCEEADFGLLFNFKSHLGDQKNAIAKGNELLADSDTKTIMKKNDKNS